MLTSGGDELGPALYFRANDLAPEKMAASAAELFLGVKLHCAECHDHPFADWKQRDFWGVAAFFARIQAPNDRQMMNNPYRLVDADARRSEDPEFRRGGRAQIPRRRRGGGRPLAIAPRPVHHLDGFERQPLVHPRRGELDLDRTVRPGTRRFAR